ncbi:MAG: hypothetical protein AB1689_20650, partial [Thermodesulfobacteriota bacterium]
PGSRRLAPLARPLPGPPPARPARRRRSALRLVASNARPRRSRVQVPRPELRLVPGRAPMLALPRRTAPPPRPRPAATSSRLGQLVFVLTMAAIGLAALATSVGQILNQRM